MRTDTLNKRLITLINRMKKDSSQFELPFLLPILDD
jgi:hypothetical protein